MAVLEVIAEPTRQRILDAVRHGERSVGELVEAVGMHQPGWRATSRRCATPGWWKSGVMRSRRLYRLRPEPLMELEVWLAPCRAEWAARLDSLDRHLQSTARPISPRKETF